MGWSGGSDVMHKLILAAKKAMPTDSTRQRFYRRAIRALQDEDWDCEEECVGEDPAYDAALKVVFAKQGVTVEDV